MVRELKVEIDAEAWHMAHTEFLFAYGRAMAEWASVERGLYYWFAGITRLKDGLARAIFYGAKGFGSRAEMLESVIPFAEQQSPEEIEFIKACIKKARNFSVFRNSIAHGEPIPVLTDDGIYVVMGKAKDISDRAIEITIKQMSFAAENFSQLASATIMAIPKNRKDTPLAELLAQVLALPKEASAESAQTGSESLQSYPGAAVRVNKKAYRATRTDPPPET